MLAEVFFWGLMVLQASEIPVDAIILTVNNEPILKSDMVLLKKKIARNEILNDLALGEWRPEELTQDHKKLKSYLIREKILDSEVKRLNLTVTMDRVEQELRDIARRNGTTRENLPQILEAQGIKFSTYQSYLKSRIEHQSLVDMEIGSKLKVSDEDLQAAYLEKYKKRPKNSFEVELHHIFFNPKKGGVTAARQRAEMVYQQLVKGADFFDLVERHSEDQQFQSKGYLGKFQKEDLDVILSEAIEQTGSGLIPRVFELKSGIHIFYIKHLKRSEDPKFVAQKEALRAYVFEQQMRQALERWFAQKMVQMHIIDLEDNGSPKP